VKIALGIVDFPQKSPPSCRQSSPKAFINTFLCNLTPIAGTPYTVTEGQSLLLPASIPHAVNPVGRFKMLLVMIRGDRNQ
jgi:hypothetical protein